LSIVQASTAPRPSDPPVQRIRLRYAKRGKLRFTSHRDVARAFERALRAAGVPMAYSQGFNPHPRISWVGAAPTGAASEAEYAEIQLVRRLDPELVRRELDAALPDGLEVLAAQESGGDSLADQVEVSRWRIELPGISAAALAAAAAALMAASEVPVERLTKDGRRLLDARGPVVSATVGAPPGDPGALCAILDLVVRQVTPAVRPDDVLAALRAVAGLAPAAPPRATRLAQGRLDDRGRLADPLAPDRAAVIPATEAGDAPRPAEQAVPSVGTTPAG